jgi:hypothetical protein
MYNAEPPSIMQPEQHMQSQVFDKDHHHFADAEVAHIPPGAHPFF